MPEAIREYEDRFRQMSAERFDLRSKMETVAKKLQAVVERGGIEDADDLH